MASTETMRNDLQVTYVEAYTPVAAQITSPYLTTLKGTTATLQYAFFQTSADADVTVVCYGGNTQSISVKGGVPYPYAVKQITACSTGVVYILHNGKQI